MCDEKMTFESPTDLTNVTKINPKHAQEEYANSSLSGMFSIENEKPYLLWNCLFTATEKRTLAKMVFYWKMPAVHEHHGQNKYFLDRKVGGLESQFSPRCHDFQGCDTFIVDSHLNKNVVIWKHYLIVSAVSTYTQKLSETRIEMCLHWKRCHVIGASVIQLSHYKRDKVCNNTLSKGDSFIEISM